MRETLKYLILIAPTLLMGMAYYQINKPTPPTRGAELQKAVIETAELFRSTDMSYDGMAQALGVKVVYKDVLQNALGQTDCNATIWMKNGLNVPTKRFVFYHEVGHIVLNHCPDWPSNEETAQTEADYFGKYLAEELGQSINFYTQR
ncbi:ImmA/IrrE family metallo-endopeptidase [Lewinella sp. W8]|uniref:ImmA/IrrE family metallo-endopeptidase n=1 Tax=Lewinella sp. W8 TaxID=2528208 RepID=UPI001068938E|nr:ImmA/IrrE family metallo-endopeptidase [Lewinella sp. W8]MTB53082.1 ImmA/IrrE family metallo-endopeptidase [Lewinella sp. W8]